MQDTHGGPVVLVSDDKSDACLAAEADFVFAKSSLIKHCEVRGIPHTPFASFEDVLRVVSTWDIAQPHTASA